MKNYYITESTKSLEDYTRSYEALLPHTTITCEANTEKFKSDAHGIISDQFYIGSNTTEYLSSIEVLDNSSCILSIPLTGNFNVTIDNQPSRNFSPKTGGLIAPVKRILFTSVTDVVHDLIIIMNCKRIMSRLKTQYNITLFPENFIELDLSNEKINVIKNFIQTTIETAKNFPNLTESYILKANVQELTLLLISDIVASSIHVEPIKHKNADLILVERAEMLMENECETLIRVKDIANKLYTTTRTLQKAFKRYRSYSPIQFLKIRKLHRARKLLMVQGPGNFTIKQAALKSGISDINRFSKDYSTLFGELPSITVKNNYLRI